MTPSADSWASGKAYEAYVGRWSRPVARQFVDWLPVEPGRRWLDVGCGTSALTQVVLAMADPLEVLGIDPSEAQVEHARHQIDDPRATFEVGDAIALSAGDERFDAVVSGLVLNFVPDAAGALAEMVRVAAPGGVVAGYVWDYAGDMQLMRYFWDAAVALDPAARELDEGVRFPLCRPEPLRALFQEAGLTDVEVRPVDISTPFRDFDDYWTPFLGGQAPAPGYAMSLPEEGLAALRDRIRSTLPIAADGSIALIARAWAVRGRKGAGPPA
ncbi:MAG TPA: methyltransferase domain-containing protein [Acidimicrobiia bacterium]|nr:methyltransferase domain-containing protein [Acidimicrobiia bacterium]